MDYGPGYVVNQSHRNDCRDAVVHDSNPQKDIKPLNKRFFLLLYLFGCYRILEYISHGSVHHSYNYCHIIIYHHIMIIII